MDRCKATGKKCYPNQTKASRIATKMWAKSPYEVIGGIHSYLCEDCGFYHIGHTPYPDLPKKKFPKLGKRRRAFLGKEYIAYKVSLELIEKYLNIKTEEE